MSNEPLTVYCAPVSGGGFVAQLGLLCEIYEAKKWAAGGVLNGSKDYQPDLVFAASGGNVASYIGLAADWSSTGIERIAKELKTSMFIRSWFPEPFSDYLPTWLAGIFHGSIYRQGYGSCDFFKAIFNTRTVQRVEIWTGTYDHCQRRAQFFCNRSESCSLVNPTSFLDDASMYSCLPLKYLSGDLKRIAKASAASASVPILVGRQHFDNSSYADGGAMYASTLTPMISELYRIVTGFGCSSIVGDRSSNWVSPLHHIKDSIEKREHQRRLRLFYFCSYEMNAPKPTKGILQDAKQILHANILQDRGAALQLLYRLAGERCGEIRHRHHPDLDSKRLGRIIHHLRDVQHYIIILYPHGCPSVSLHGFSTCDLVHKINSTRRSYGGHVWYLPH